MSFTLRFILAIAALVVAAVSLATFERPPVNSTQTGFRGLGIEQVQNPRLLQASLAANTLPEVIQQVPAIGPKAGQVYRNVRVLGDLSVGQFTRLMAAITTWVSPQQGCNYCHVDGDLASEAVYTKIVSRRMLEMVAQINTQWQQHVSANGPGGGVTCWTCHRGNPVPLNVWARNPGPTSRTGFATAGTGQNLAGSARNPGGTMVGYTSLPYDPFTAYLQRDENIRVASLTALPAGSTRNIKDTELSYALMMHISQGMGVNCTYCHNTRSFFDWDQSAPQRTIAWHGIRMVREINLTYIEPLLPSLPASRRGPHGDALKVNCTTCHQGAALPLLGQSRTMLQQYPELSAIRQQAR